jgi:O-antigen/teichoic acid export membrane protein
VTNLVPGTAPPAEIAPPPPTGPEFPRLPALGAAIGGTLGRQAAVLVAGLGFAILCARVLGPAGNGAFAIAVLVPALLSRFLELGIVPASVYIVNRGEPLAVVLRSTLRLGAMLSVVGLACGSGLLVLYGARMFPGVSPALLWGGLALFPLMLLHALIAGLLQARQDFRAYNTALLVAPVTTLAVGAAGFVLVGATGDVALAAVAAGHLIAFAIAGLALAAHLKTAAVSAPDPHRSAVRPLLSFGWRSHGANVLTFVNQRLALLLLTVYLGPAATGIYVVGAQLAERLWILSEAVSTVLFPRLSALHLHEAERRRLTPLLGRMVLALSAVAALALALVGRPVIQLLFGDAYAAAYLPMLWLLPGVVALSLSRVLSSDIAARGRPGLNALIAALALVCNVGLAWWLIPAFGMAGAAAAASVVYLLVTLVKVVFYLQLTGGSWHALARGGWLRSTAAPDMSGSAPRNEPGATR